MFLQFVRLYSAGLEEQVFVGCRLLRAEAVFAFLRRCEVLPAK
jgi:hypothetical protein